MVKRGRPDDFTGIDENHMKRIIKSLGQSYGVSEFENITEDEKEDILNDLKTIITELESVASGKKSSNDMEIKLAMGNFNKTVVDVMETRGAAILDTDADAIKLAKRINEFLIHTTYDESLGQRVVTEKDEPETKQRVTRSQTAATKAAMRPVAAVGGKYIRKKSSKKKKYTKKLKKHKKKTIKKKKSKKIKSKKRR